jgi:hypothetical protein
MDKAHLNAAAGLSPAATQAIQVIVSAAADRLQRIYILFHVKAVEKDGLHDWCMDGLFAAFAAFKAMPEADLVPAMYNHPPELELESGDQIYLLDLTYPAPVLEAWADAGALIEVIDHHKQAMDDLALLSARVLREFDMARSGAVMAWQRFQPSSPVPALYSYVQDRDLWEKTLPDCDLIALGLRELLSDQLLIDALWHIGSFLEKTRYAPLLELRGFGLAFIAVVGARVGPEIKQAIAEAVAVRTKRLVLGQEVVFVALWSKRQRQAYSDIGHALLRASPECAYAVVQSGPGFGGWSLRSNATHQGVQRVAKMLGGGGHEQASGCAADMPLWAALLVQWLRWRLRWRLRWQR